MIPPEADGKLLLLVQAERRGRHLVGRAAPRRRGEPAPGRQPGRQARPERARPRGSALAARPRPAAGERADQVARTGCGGDLRAASGQQRVNELFRRAQRMRVSRTVVATVAMQDDYMKRVRGGGGARDQLRAEGIVIFGDYAGDQVLASALGLPRPGPGRVRQRPAGPAARRPPARPARRAAAPGRGLCPVDPARGRRLAARLGRRSGRARARAAPLTTSRGNRGTREAPTAQVKPRPTRRKRLRRQPRTGIVWLVRKHSRSANEQRRYRQGIRGGGSAAIRSGQISRIGEGI